MTDEKLIKRFGATAIEKGFITKDQFIEAIAIQITDEVEGIKPKYLGLILKAIGYMTDDQISEVLEGMAGSVQQEKINL